MRVRLVGLAVSVLLLAAACGRPDGTSPDLIDPLTSAGESVTVTGDCGSELAGTLRAWAGSGFSGVAVFDGPDGRCTLSAGVADASLGLVNDPATVFRAGSYTKLITQAAVAELIAGGEITLTDTVGMFFADLPADKAAITIGELLTHASGLDSTHALDDERLTRSEALTRIANQQLLFQPGGGESYSNTGYTVLAAVIEEVTGITYREAVRDLVLALPDGSVGLGWWSGSFASEGVRAQAFDDGEFAAVPFDLDDEPWALEGAGGMASTVPAVVDLHRALERGDAISTEAWSLVTTRAEQTDAGRAIAGFGGGSGHNYGVIHYLDAGWIGAAASNDSRFRAEDLLIGLMPALVLGEPLPQPVQTTEGDPAVGATMVGEWQLSGGGSIVIEDNGGALILTATDDAAMALLFPAPEGWEFPRNDHVAIFQAAIDDGSLLAEFGFDPATQVLIVGTAWEEIEWRTYWRMPKLDLGGWIAFESSGALAAAVSGDPAPRWDLVATGATSFSLDPPPGLRAPELTLDVSANGELTIMINGAAVGVSR